MILLDWTRMGKAYCLAGAVRENGTWRIVRPLLARNRTAPARNMGWSAYLLDGHSRWEIFEVIAPEAAAPEPPHLEDCWARTLRPCRQLAAPDDRRTILTATTVNPGEPLFGVHLTGSRGAAYLKPGTGSRSLATLTVPAAKIHFCAALRGGMTEPDVRLTLDVPGLESCQLPVKDHHLLGRVERTAPSLQALPGMLDEYVRRMGEQVAVRLGLSRPFFGRPDAGPGYCWLMADGFFSLADPQP
jgi:hypothetical protein